MPLLVCECTFLKEHQNKARATFHLCTSDLNVLIQEPQPQFLLPMHLSRTYLGNKSQLVQELEVPKDVQILKIPPRLTSRPIYPYETQIEFCE